MPKSYYKPSDLDEPILKGKSLGFSIEEIAAVLGIERTIVADRIQASMAPKPLPAVVMPPRNRWTSTPHSKRTDEAANPPKGTRYAAWLKARNGAHATLKGREHG